MRKFIKGLLLAVTILAAVPVFSNPLPYPKIVWTNIQGPTVTVTPGLTTVKKLIGRKSTNPDTIYTVITSGVYGNVGDGATVTYNSSTQLINCLGKVGVYGTVTFTISATNALGVGYKIDIPVVNPVPNTWDTLDVIDP